MSSHHFSADGFRVYCLFWSISGFCEEFYVLLDTIVSLTLRINPSEHLVYVTNGYTRTFNQQHDFEAQGTAILFFFFFVTFFWTLFHFNLRLSGNVALCANQASSFFSAQDQPVGITLFGHLWPPAPFCSSLRFSSFGLHLFVSSQQFKNLFPCGQFMLRGNFFLRNYTLPWSKDSFFDFQVRFWLWSNAS